MSTTKLPAIPEAGNDELVVYEPPTAFEVIDRGSATSVTFQSFGDSFVGIFEDMEEMTDEGGEVYSMATFTGADAKPYCIFPGASLKRALRKLTKSQWCRITYTMDIDTGQPSPLKGYVVEVGK